MSGPYFKDLEKSRTEHGQRLVNGVLVFALAAKSSSTSAVPAPPTHDPLPI